MNADGRERGRLGDVDAIEGRNTSCAFRAFRAFRAARAARSVRKTCPRSSVYSVRSRLVSSISSSSSSSSSSESSSVETRSGGGSISSSSSSSSSSLVSLEDGMNRGPTAGSAEERGPASRSEAPPTPRDDETTLLRLEERETPTEEDAESGRGESTRW